MEQTLAEKLRILADAAEAGELNIFVSAGTHRQVSSIVCAWQTTVDHHTKYTFARIPPKPATIKVGHREINAPLRVMPKVGNEYWVSWVRDSPSCYVWGSNAEFDSGCFNNAECWATKEDAKAYAEASRALRKGEA